MRVLPKEMRRHERKEGMTTQQIRIWINNARIGPDFAGQKQNALFDICMELLNRIETLEVDADRERILNRKAANEASCLANGIIPD
jgi:hypothetical protein